MNKEKEYKERDTKETQKDQYEDTLPGEERSQAQRAGQGQQSGKGGSQQGGSQQGGKSGESRNR